MFEWLTIPARRAVADAHDTARLAGRSAITTGDLLVGLLAADGAVAGDVLRRVVDGEALEVAARAVPEGVPESEDLLRLVLCAAVGVAAARGTRRIGSASLLLALAALEPPGLSVLRDAVGLDVENLAAAARQAADDSEVDVAAGDVGWMVTAADGDADGAWNDREG